MLFWCVVLVFDLLSAEAMLSHAAYVSPSALHGAPALLTGYSICRWNNVAGVSILALAGRLCGHTLLGSAAVAGTCGSTLYDDISHVGGILCVCATLSGVGVAFGRQPA